MSRLVAACSIFLTATTTSASGSVLDQSYVVTNHVGGLSIDVGTNSIGKIEVSQSFTVGISGRLDQADVFLWGQPHSNLLLEVRRTLPDGLPSESPNDLIGAVITEFKGGPSPFNNWVEFHFNGRGPMVTAGEQLALVLKVPGSEHFSWSGEWTGAYEGGRAALRSSASLGQWSSSGAPNADLGFQTHVEQVPEPSTLAVLLVGGVGTIAVTRRRIRERANNEG